ncbi:hypothetical protein LX36DRAFT_459108 [Colletotrichum falcatum]|nr:hypothetical protein LX36DRAFT_459108 [Colletotrichum falcatum]
MRESSSPTSPAPKQNFIVSGPPSSRRLLTQTTPSTTPPRSAISLNLDLVRLPDPPAPSSLPPKAASPVAVDDVTHAHALGAAVPAPAFGLEHARDPLVRRLPAFALVAPDCGGAALLVSPVHAHVQAVVLGRHVEFVAHAVGSRVTDSRFSSPCYFQFRIALRFPALIN